MYGRALVLSAPAFFFVGIMILQGRSNNITVHFIVLFLRIVYYDTQDYAHCARDKGVHISRQNPKT
jgi:hypothetical protein